MSKEITNNTEISPGDIYEDSAYHPCLCLEVNGYEVWGISLVDGSYPRSDDIALGGVRKLSLEEAWIWKTKGPADVVLEDKSKWW